MMPICRRGLLTKELTRDTLLFDNVIVITTSSEQEKKADTVELGLFNEGHLGSAARILCRRRPRH